MSVSNSSDEEDLQYLQELKRLRDHEAKSARLRKFLDTEILASERKMKYHKLVAQRKKIADDVELLAELLEQTSQVALRQDVIEMMVPLQKECKQLTDEITKAEMTKEDIKSRLVQCEEMLAHLIYSVSDITEANTEVQKPAENVKESPWLKLCEAKTGLDAHQSGLPTNTIDKYAWDQSDAFVKLYIEIPGLKETDQKKVMATYSERYFSLLLADVGGCNYKLHLAKLTDAIDGDKSTFRLKKGRVVVFLKKRLSKYWLDLNDCDASTKAEVLKTNSEAAMVRLAELMAVASVKPKGCPENEWEFMAKHSYYLVKDVVTAQMTMEYLRQRPPKLCEFHWEEESLETEETLRAALQAVAQTDCFVMWEIKESRGTIARYDDERVEILLNGKCTLISFSGRLSKWSLLPSSVLQVTAYTTCADDVNSIASCTASFQELGIVIQKHTQLDKLMPLRAGLSLLPVRLSFVDMRDCDVDWLLEAVKKLLPARKLPNGQQLTTTWRLILPGCQMSIEGHRHLCLDLLCGVVAVHVHDLTDTSEIKDFANKYAARNCSFQYVAL